MTDLDQKHQKVKIKKNTYKSPHDLFEGGELTLKGFRSVI